MRLPKNVVPSESFIDQLLTLSNENRFDDKTLNQTEVMYGLLKQYERNRYTREYLKYQWTSLYNQLGASRTFDFYKAMLLLHYQRHCYREKMKAMKFPKGFWDD